MYQDLYQILQKQEPREEDVREIVLMKKQIIQLQAELKNMTIEIALQSRSKAHIITNNQMQFGKPNSHRIANSQQRTRIHSQAY